jgi:hypothetical protein
MNLNPGRCDEVEPLLVAFELGATEGAERDACDAHLAGCSSCLASFLQLKRTREDAAAFDQRPGPQVRDRLRARVSNRSKRGPALWAAAAAALAALALVLRLLSLHSNDPARPGALVDSAPLSEDLL